MGRSGIGAFVRLWFVLFFSYTLLKFAFNIGVMRWIDLRVSFLLEIGLIPMGQTIVLWVISRGARAPADRRTVERSGP